ncbi:MAG: hypothetical protein WCL08_11940, partial [Verrucomicrobiota bacterium]
GLLFLPIVWLQFSSRRAPQQEPHEADDTFEDFKSFKGFGTSSGETVPSALESAPEAPALSQTQTVQPPPLPQAQRVPEKPAEQEPTPTVVGEPVPAQERSLKLSVPAASIPPSPPSEFPSTAQTSEDSKRVRATPSPEKASSSASNGWDFYPPLPKVQHSRSKLSPEEEMAEQLKPLPPTPPPIRFEWGAGR